PALRADNPALRDRPDKVLALGLRRRAGAPLPGPPRQPAEALEALPGRPRGARPLGRLRRGEGRDVRPHRHRGLTLVRGRVRRQALDPPQPDQPPARTDPLPAGRPGAGEAAAAPAARLRAAAEVDRETGPRK